MTILTPSAAIRLREATSDDAKVVADIWRRGVAASLGFETAFPDAEIYFLNRIDEQSDTFKFWLAIDATEKVIGWQSLMPTRVNPILRGLFAESSTYVDQHCGIRGIGSALIEKASRHADTCDLHYIVGYISISNVHMRNIVSNAGWVEIGKVPQSLKEPYSPQGCSTLSTEAQIQKF